MMLVSIEITLLLLISIASGIATMHLRGQQKQQQQQQQQHQRQDQRQQQQNADGSRWHHLQPDKLEELAFKYGTDKSKDDHKYVDVYSNFFQHRRFTIRNVTEIGVSMGQSLQVWNDYFPQARIHGVDIQYEDPIINNLAPLKRVTLHKCNVLQQTEVQNLPLAPESMDLIIDDGPHDRNSQEIVLKNFWPYLKPGGMYIMEDVDAQDGGLDFQENPDKLTEHTREVFTNNHVFFVDASVGHRAWEKFVKTLGPKWARNHRIHNSYLIVIRKRIGAVPPILMHSGVRAMHEEEIVKTKVSEQMSNRNKNKKSKQEQ